MIFRKLNSIHRAKGPAIYLAQANGRGLHAFAPIGAEGAYSEVLVKYRKALPTFFPAEHAVVESLPRLTPLPGTAPQDVTLSGEWIAQPGYAVLSWTASTDPNLEAYEVRMSVGPTYDADSETVVGSQPPGMLNLQTLQGLSSPGSVASFKVFVILTTGNESGSNAVTITRPSP